MGQQCASRLKDDNMISALAKKVVVDAETISIQSTLNRFTGISTWHH